MSLLARSAIHLGRAAIFAAHIFGVWSHARPKKKKEKPGDKLIRGSLILVATCATSVERRRAQALKAFGRKFCVPCERCLAETTKYCVAARNDKLTSKRG